MREPYAVMIRAMCLFKAAGLRIPAVTHGDKQRLLNCWVERYGRAEAADFLAAVRQLTAGRYFPRFCDMDAALGGVRRSREKRQQMQAAPIDREANRKRMQALVTRLAKRRN